MVKRSLPACLPASVLVAALAMSLATSASASHAACAVCHGADGNSAAAVFPKIAGLNEKYLLRQLRDIKSGRRALPEMAGQLDALTDLDLQELSAFYSQQTMSGSVAKAELADLGERIYRGGMRERKVAACTACHSPTGAGNPLIGFPRIGGQFAEYIAKRLRHYRISECEEGEQRCMMTQTARQLSDAAIEAVASYVSGLGE